MEKFAKAMASSSSRKKEADMANGGAPVVRHLRPHSKWRVAKRVLNLMDSNRASSEKQDMADIVKMFQRINAQQIFDNLNTQDELKDINSGLHTVNAKETLNFKDMEASAQKLTDHKYDSLEMSDELSQDLDQEQKRHKRHFERMDSSHIFQDIGVRSQRSLDDIQKDHKFSRADSVALVGDVDTSGLFDDLSLEW